MIISKTQSKTPIFSGTLNPIKTPYGMEYIENRSRGADQRRSIMRLEQSNDEFLHSFEVTYRVKLTSEL